MCVDLNNNIYFIGKKGPTGPYRLYRANRSSLIVDAGGREQYACDIISSNFTITNDNSTTPIPKSGPGPMTYDPLGFIWIADATSTTLTKYSATTTSSMNAISTYTTGGFTKNVTALATDSEGWIWVATGVGPIYKFNPSSAAAATAMYWNVDNRPSATTSGDYWSNAQYGSVKGLAFDRDGNLYVTDDTFHQVIQFPYACPPFPLPTSVPSIGESGLADIQVGSFANTSRPYILFGGSEEEKVEG